MLMTPAEKKAKFDELAHRVLQIANELSAAAADLESEMDRDEAESIHTDLIWAVENLAVIGLHTIGDALDDTFGRGSRKKKS